MHQIAVASMAMQSWPDEITASFEAYLALDGRL